MKNKRKEAITMSNVELGTIVNIKTGKLDANASSDSGAYPFFTCSREPLKIDTYSYDCECVLVAGNGDLNVKYYSGKFDAYQRTYIIEASDKRKLFVKYLYYFVDSIIDFIRSQSIGGVIKYIKLGDLTSLKLPLPSLERQREIAAVLDKASELVDKRKAQLAELDRLAESIFYDMFGDPVTNPKGWSHKTLSELGEWKSGGTPSRNNSGYFCGKIPWVSSGELNNMYIGNTNEHITEDAILNSNTKKIKVGSILLGMYDTAALKSSITKRIMCCNQAIAYSRLEDNVADTLFVYTVIQICKEEYKKLQRGIRQKNLNLSMIKAISIIYPPLALQQQFAERIEKIEEQKAKAKDALKESENLFQRLMQDMFNPEYHNS